MTATQLPKAQQFASAETYQRAIKLATKAWMMAMETGSEATLKASKKMFLLASQMKNARIGSEVYIQDIVSFNEYSLFMGTMKMVRFG